MATENERVFPSTKVSPPETEGSCSATSRPEQPKAFFDARLPIGHLLGGRYRIERELGKGGMGIVYLARDEQIAGDVFAVKVLKEELHPDALTLLHEEVRKTRKLSHQNIVDVHSVNVDGEQLYVLMEYLEGKSLDKLLDEEFGRGMPFSHAWPIIEDVGAALGNAHDHNVIHSDLKPANVFLTNSGRTKLLDFGIARVSRGPLLRAASGPRALTPAYASCEMLEGKEADRRDDIYSFACVVYEILCGERPFGELTALEAREAGTKVPSLGVLTQGQNAALAQALAFDRDRRTSSIEELLHGLAADRKPRRLSVAVLGAALIAAGAAVGLTYLVLDKLWVSRRAVVVQSVAGEAEHPSAPVAPTTVFAPPPHSIAVLPFANISGDKEQDYFSDGLTDELLNSLARINELQVTGHTSAFYFKGEHADLATIAHKLNVAAILEGSVRRSEHTVRVSAQLINAVTGFGLWSETYDRDLGDVLKVQTEIADAVTSALKITLLDGAAEKVQLGGTRNPAAFDAYLRGLRLSRITLALMEDCRAPIDAFSEAIERDPNYALAYARRALFRWDCASYSTAWLRQAGIANLVRVDAERAIELAPGLADGYVALSNLEEGLLNLSAADQACTHALALAPSNDLALNYCSFLAVAFGRADAGITLARRCVAADPLNALSYRALGDALQYSRRYSEATAAYQNSIALDPEHADHAYWQRARSYYLAGNLAEARASCEVKPDYWYSLVCKAIIYQKLGRRDAASAAMRRALELARDAGGYQYAEIYAQWGENKAALDWLEKAMRLRDTGLVNLRADPLMDPLRREPRFQAIERALKFPN